MKRIAAALALCSMPFTGFTQARPKLIVGIVVDQMRWDYLQRYAGRFGEGGFKRLMREGFSCEQTLINYLPSYTAPGHATIYTGTTPAFHGITGNDWPAAEGYASVYCCADTGVRSVGSLSAAGQMSPRNLKATTVGDELRLATNFRARVFGVSLKDRGAVLPAGHSANGAFWFDDSTGNFISSTYYYQQLPAWVQRFNAVRYADSLLIIPWSLSYPADSYQQSIADNNAFEYTMKGEAAPVFPHRFAAGDYKSIRRSPAGNQLSFLFAKTLIESEALGSNNCDMLALSLSATDYVGHAYGPNSRETEDLYIRLDRQLASFLRFLDLRYGKDGYLIFLTADHGAAHNSEWLKSQRMPAGNLPEAELRKGLNAELYKRFAKDSLVRLVMNYQVFFDEQRIRRSGIKRSAVKEAALDWCRQQEGIYGATDMESLALQSVPQPLRNLLEQSYYASRCGSLGLIYQPGWYSDGKKGTTHGTWNLYDRHIPLLWYGWAVRPGRSYQLVEMTDIAVTLSAMLGIQMPNAATGKVIPDLLP